MVITKKSDIIRIGNEVLEELKAGQKSFLAELEKKVLSKKVKFPILEHLALMFYENIPTNQLFHFCDKIIDMDYEGGYPLVGKCLQFHLEKDLDFCFDKAVNYILRGNVWYACDLISERVFGHGMLVDFQRSFPKAKNLTKHESDWIGRGIGVATHYAVKKKLPKADVEKLLELALSESSRKEFHVKRGVGWGAKTIAKFHPDLIEKHREQVEERMASAKWFATKINIGLDLSKKYAKA